MSGERWDAVVLGSGHNGLVAATRLAKSGVRTLIVEPREAIGGLAAGLEFHPGYRHLGVADDTSQLRPWVTKSLGLASYGLEVEGEHTPIFSPAPAGEGDGLLLAHEPDAAAGELGGEAAAYADYRGYLDRLAPFARKALDRMPPDVSDLKLADLWSLGTTAVGLRLLGRRDMMELFRIGPMCVADWLRERFSSDRLNALLAAPAVYGGFTGPWSPGTNANLLLFESFKQPEVRGGSAALVAALEAAARDAGVEFRTGTTVARLLLDDDTVAGLELEGGERIEAGVVAAAGSPKHALLELIPRDRLSLRLEHRITHFRTRGTTAHVFLALAGYPSLACRPDLQAEHFRIAEGIDPLEQAFDPVKYRRFGSDLSLDVRVPTVRHPDLAPPGHQVASIGVHFVPYHLESGWTDESRAALQETVIQRLEAYAPGVRSLVVGAQTLTPADLETEYGLTGGQIHHGEHGLDQLFVRPAPECARYDTPIRGLYLCGGGSFPGGGITGAPGALGAERVLAQR